MLNWVRKKKKIETLAWGSVVGFEVDGGYSVRAVLDKSIEAWHVTVSRGEKVVAKSHCAVGTDESRTREFLQEIYDRGELEKLINSQKWLLDNRVPDRLWDRAVSASDDFLVLRVLGDPKRYRIYHRTANGDITLVFQFKEFYASGTFIRSPKDFPPEKIKEKWEEWSYPNEFYAG
jgi:hypothetical protein